MGLKVLLSRWFALALWALVLMVVLSGEPMEEWWVVLPVALVSIAVGASASKPSYDGAQAPQTRTPRAATIAVGDRVTVQGQEFRVAEVAHRGAETDIRLTPAGRTE